MNDRNSHTGESLTYKELNALKECSDKYHYRKLSLHRKGYERREFIRNAFRSMMCYFRSGKSLMEVDSLLENDIKSGLKREWFDFNIQHECAVKSNLMAFIRMARYLEGGYTVKETDLSAKAEVNFIYKGIHITELVVDVPAVLLNKEGKPVIVLFEEGENPFSYSARKEINYPSCSLALICAYLAFAPVYGDDVRVETWYLKAKGDKAGCLVEQYEVKPGKNIAGFCFNDRITALSKLKEVLSVQEEHNCNNCRQKDVCRFPREIRTNPEKLSSSDENPKFTPVQEKVIRFKEGAMCCIAVPGAGKTFALVNRIVNLLKSGTLPENILVVTFTDKAAAELKQRIRSLMGTMDESKVPDVFTFNTFGYMVLRDNPLLVSSRVKIAEMVDRLALIKQALAICPAIKNTSYDNAYVDFGLIRMLDDLFGELEADGRENFITRYGQRKDVNGILAVFDEYQRLFKEEGFISYDRQISYVNVLFRKYSSLVEKYAQQYRYIMVDDFQDINTEQASMVYAIAKSHGNIVVVGDDDQSSYTWRGGSSRFILDFQDDFPSAEMVFMNDNFRSNNGILDLATELISQNSGRFEKTLIGHREAKHRPVYWKNATAEGAVKIITSAVKNGYKPKDIAVLARTNKRLMEVQTALNGLAKTESRKNYLRDDSVFLMLYDVLVLYYEGMDNDVSLYRFLTFFGATLGRKKNRQLSLYAELTKNGIFPGIDRKRTDMLESFEKEKDSSKYHLAAYKLLQVFKCIQYSHGLKEILEQICSILFGLKSHPVMECLLEKADRRAIVTVCGLYSLMEKIVLFSDSSRVGYEPKEDAVNFLTCHEAKGSEFPFVIVYGVEDFKDEPDENRLLYVAMTRAKDTLFMLESVYSTCELLPYFAANVNVR